MRRIVIVSLWVAFLSPLGALAQLGIPTGTDPLSISLSPESPRPGSPATVTLHSSALDLNAATIVVKVGGAAIYSGPNQPVSVPLGPAGTATTISATATSAGQSYSTSVKINPGDVTLVVEPISSAPALYAGKPLIADGGAVRLVAVADLRTTPSKQLSPASLVYTWREDGAILENVSGIGRSTINVAAPMPYRSSSVSVSVTSPDGSIVGGDSVNLTPQTPTLRLYINDPLLGIVYDRALAGSVRITSSEVSLVAVPYSFPIDSGTPVVNWFLNGSAAQTGGPITLRPSGSGSGSATVSASVSGADAFTNASADLNLLFGVSSTNFLGL